MPVLSMLSKETGKDIERAHLVVRHLEQHQLPRSERVKHLKSNRGNHCTEEATVDQPRERDYKINSRRLTFAT